MCGLYKGPFQEAEAAETLHLQTKMTRRRCWCWASSDIGIDVDVNFGEAVPSPGPQCPHVEDNEGELGDF